MPRLPVPRTDDVRPRGRRRTVATLPARRCRDERGTSAVELAFYGPVLMLLTFLIVQTALLYLGNQTAGSVAREAARVARTTGSASQAEAAGRAYAERVGGGVFTLSDVQVSLVAADRVRVTVSGRSQEIVPVLVPEVSETVEGPIERFVGGE
ncbi:TadE/TadG family type IV pilus assembly protein [Nocardioides bruguierae]|uniref:Pilus assembly protein n=1 Tax=Nocardioides bruguierae TaxID=2945102 RepID=A0A9X2D8G6_9ACTN|nr:TadE/TadG family type IV pilus assembly protein [Nocardioides bruguierae]MCM0621270.1 pilus assembly protein [Nocardioides bruguierae]